MYEHGTTDLPAKDETEGKHQIRNVACSLGEVHTGDDGDGKGGGKEEELLHVQPHQPCSLRDSVGEFGVAVVADGVVPAQEEYRSDEN